MEEVFMRYAVIMAGGSGTRLWPMSRRAEPKQVIPFMDGRSLVSLAYQRLEGLVEPDKRLVSAGETHRSLVFRELPGLPLHGFLGEPVGRDSYAAIALASAVVARRDPLAVIGFFAADHLIEPIDRFRECVERGFRVTEDSPETLVTFGVAPTCPATGFGYLNLGREFLHGSRIVNEFKEKPDGPTAERYVAEGPGRWRWNAGMFAWKASTFLDCVHRYDPDTFASISRIAESWETPRFQAVIGEVYPGLRKISVDYAVMEPASRDPRVKVAAVPMDLSWTDIGSWSAFAQASRRDESENAVSARTCIVKDTSGTLVVSSDPGHLVAVMGCEDLVIVHTPDATLVCRKQKAEEVKELWALVTDRFGSRYA
jgi:mannose-1-phosphate guanylyltransferase